MTHLAALAILLPSFLFGQDIAGDWQGALKFGKIESRLVVSIAKGTPPRQTEEGVPVTLAVAPYRNTFLPGR